MVAGPSMAVLRDNIGAAAVLWDIVGLWGDGNDIVAGLFDTDDDCLHDYRSETLSMVTLDRVVFLNWSSGKHVKVECKSAVKVPSNNPPEIDGPRVKAEVGGVSTSNPDVVWSSFSSLVWLIRQTPGIREESTIANRRSTPIIVGRVGFVDISAGCSEVTDAETTELTSTPWIVIELKATESKKTASETTEPEAIDAEVTPLDTTEAAAELDAIGNLEATFETDVKGKSEVTGNLEVVGGSNAPGSEG
jgi:hypothetical protein